MWVDYRKGNIVSSIEASGRKVAYKILNNRIVEAIVVALIATCFLVASAIDRWTGAKFEKAFIHQLHKASQDKLSNLRIAQIRHIFRKRYGLSKIRLKLAGGSYWLSIPCIVTGIDRKTGQQRKFMAKIINNMSALKHRYMTMLRNLGVFAGSISGDIGLKFDEYVDAREMIEFEQQCLIRMGETIDTPAVLGLHHLNEDDYVLVIEYIEGKPLSEVGLGSSEIDQIFHMLKMMHDNEFIHGDIKLDNFLLSNHRIYVVDCLKIGSTAPVVARSFDLICAICSLAEKAPVSMVIEYARKYFSDTELLNAGKLLDIAVSKVDIDLPGDKIEELRKSLGGPETLRV